MILSIDCRKFGQSWRMAACGRFCLQGLPARIKFGLFSSRWQPQMHWMALPRVNVVPQVQRCQLLAHFEQHRSHQIGSPGSSISWGFGSSMAPFLNFTECWRSLFSTDLTLFGGENRGNLTVSIYPRCTRGFATASSELKLITRCVDNLIWDC